MQSDIEKAFEKYLNIVQEMINKWYEANHPTLDRYIITYTSGPKYWRVVKERDNDRSVHSFVRKADGAILKAGTTWKAPAPNGVRGNITAQDGGANCITWCGTKYLR